MSDLNELVGLSHKLGTCDYVKGGGGNTSVKDGDSLWVKPSGTTLATITAEDFVVLDRVRIGDLYGIEPPSEAAAREELVKNVMAAAIRDGGRRPSVEAALHNTFSARFVVHTHPALVNGLTCARGGAEACARLFPEALWAEYIDPGYTLCMGMRKCIEQYSAEHGREPRMLILKNHGIFVAADTSEEVRGLYAHVMDTLREAYRQAAVSTTVPVDDAACDDQATIAAIHDLFGEDAAGVASSGAFTPPPGPLTPDHLIYARALPYVYELNEEGAERYRSERGYAPKVIVAGGRVYGIGTSQKNAELALEIALDGAEVTQLADAFGGVEFMTDAARDFIENWEVESYRLKQV